ncbi:MAG TPA: hypothetical protein VGB73_18440 [Pyrinomonadaceae bacterium]|jgi:hypothetical protein
MMNDECGIKDKTLSAFHSSFRIPNSSFLSGVLTDETQVESDAGFGFVAG